MCNRSGRCSTDRSRQRWRLVRYIDSCSLHVCVCVYVCVSVNMSMCVCVYVCVYVRLYCRFRLKWTTRRYLLQNFSELRSNSKHFLVFTLHLYEAKRLFL